MKSLYSLLFCVSFSASVIKGNNIEATRNCFLTQLQQAEQQKLAKNTQTVAAMRVTWERHRAFFTTAEQVVLNTRVRRLRHHSHDPFSNPIIIDDK